MYFTLKTRKRLGLLIIFSLLISLASIFTISSVKAEVIFDEDFENWNEHSWTGSGLFSIAEVASYTGTYGMRANTSYAWVSRSLIGVTSSVKVSFYFYANSIVFTTGYKSILELLDEYDGGYNIAGISLKQDSGNYYFLSYGFVTSGTLYQIELNNWYKLEMYYLNSAEGICNANITKVSTGVKTTVLSESTDNTIGGDNGIRYVVMGMNDAVTSTDLYFDNFVVENIPIPIDYGTVLQLPFDNETSTTAYDYSNSTNNGIITGATRSYD